MQTSTHHSPTVREGALAAKFPPIQFESRPTVGTEQAAYYLHRQQQTLRGWACREDGPIRPIRVFGRLAWKTEEIKKLLGVA